MALNAIGGLAAGLAQGINNGMQIRNQQEMIDLRKQEQGRLAKQDERDAEIHELRKDQYTSEKEIRDRRNNALRQIAEYTSQALGMANQQSAPAATTRSIQDPNAPSFGAQAQPQTPSSIQLAGPIPQGGLAMSAPAAPFAADNPTGALTPQAAPQQQETIKPGKILERGMVTGAYSPKMLTDIANIFAANGLHEEGIKYMNQAYTAQQRGAVQAATAFMQNNPEAAAQALQQGGIELEGLPEKAKPDDPENMDWKIKIKGGGERTINVRDWMQSTMDPEKFFEREDRLRKQQRESDLDERKFKLDERKTNAQIGFFNSRSGLADARAEAAGQPGGGLRASRSSEAQINTALSRRDKAFDRISMVKGEFGEKAEIDPMRRQELDSASSQYQGFLEDLRGEELDAREHHKFTDAMLSYPIGGTEAQIEEWQRKQLLPRFGIRPKKKEAGALAESPASTSTSVPVAGQPGLAPASQPAGPKPGSLAWMKQQADQRAAINNEMEAVQRALQAPNLSVEQRKALALKAQEIAARRDASR